MLIGQLILFAVVVFVLFYLYSKAKLEKINLSKYYIIASGVLGVVFFLRFMWGYEAIEEVVALNGTIFDSKFLTLFSVVSIWLQYASVLALILYPFFKTKSFVSISKYLCFFASIFGVINLWTMTKGVCGSDAYAIFNFRVILLGLELAISFVYSIVVWLENERFKLRKNQKRKLLYIVGMLLVTMPPYLIQSVFGLGSPALEIKNFTFLHRLVLYGIVVLPFVIYFIFRKKDFNTRKFALLYISLGALLVFSCHFKFEEFVSPISWPLHLCHTAMYIVPLCLIFKWNKIFYFTFFINVLGAFLAMAMPGTDVNVLDADSFVFWINHYAAFFMPILLISLKIYERPRFKQILYSLVAFTVYFVFILIINAWFTNYGEVDFFYTNSDFIADKLGLWAESLRDVTLNIKISDLNLVFYPLYQFLFWLVYVAATFGMWFLYELGFSMADSYGDMVLKCKLQIQQKMDMVKIFDGRNEGEPMKKENENKLVLENFSKKYGNSRYYAVKDANLEVCGGEIFGFLGPNGAGKSTIIKSIVGIQSISQGAINVCGYDVDRQSVQAKHYIGFVPDHYALYEKLTGREYINYIADLYLVSLKDRNERIDKYIKLFDLQSAFDNQMKTYSHGMKQKITIIAALVHNPKVWILDEPLTGLDPNSIYQVKECMKEHARKGNIVFFSSHIIDVVERICDRIAIIKKGQIMCCEKVSDIEKSGTLESFYMSVIEQSANNEREKIEQEITDTVSGNKNKK